MDTIKNQEKDKEVDVDSLEKDKEEVDNEKENNEGEFENEDSGKEGDEGSGNEGEEGDKEVDEDNDFYKKQYSESTREAQILAQKNRQFIESVDKASAVDVTEDELKATYSQWGELSDFEKSIARDNLVNKKKFDLVHETVQATRKIDEWATKVDEYVEDERMLAKYPQLAGREQLFKNYATKPTHVGIDMDVLVNAFTNVKVNTAKTHKGSMFQKASGGEKPAKKEMTPEDVSIMRKTNPRQYQYLVKTGKINISL